MLSAIIPITLGILLISGASAEVLDLKVYDNGGCFNWIRQKYVQCAKFVIESGKFIEKGETFEVHMEHANNSKTPYKDVRKVVFSGGEMKYYPGHLFQYYDDLTQLVINDTKTTSIDKGFLSFTIDLKVFESENNPLKKIGPDTFVEASSLGVLHLEKNDLEEIHNDAFAGLIELKSLSLSRNKLTQVNPLWFKDLEQLIVLEFTNNKLKSLDGAVFARLKILKKLYVQHNEIEKLEENVFKDNSRLRFMNFSHNKLKEIPDKVFSKIMRLRDLNLRENVCIDMSFFNQTLEVIEKVLMEKCRPS